MTHKYIHHEHHLLLHLSVKRPPTVWLSIVASFAQRVYNGGSRKVSANICIYAQRKTRNKSYMHNNSQIIADAVWLGFIGPFSADYMVAVFGVWHSNKEDS